MATIFVAVLAGKYLIGASELLDNPRREVILRSFQIAKFETTNTEFYEFTQATGYSTDAERLHNASVFEPGLKEFRWRQDRTANWHYPNGIARGGIQGKMNHPVTTISFADAEAYCRWRGVRLPTLVEWEVAARAGTTGNQFFINGTVGDYANVWHGKDHLKPDMTDGYVTTSPVGMFKPNPWGLYDVYGNVFEFCQGKMPRDNVKTRHSRGGSWWCSKNSCCFFNSVDIGSVGFHASFSNQGFRVARTQP